MTHKVRVHSWHTWPPSTLENQAGWQAIERTVRSASGARWRVPRRGSHVASSRGAMTRRDATARPLRVNATPYPASYGERQFGRDEVERELGASLERLEWSIRRV
jgi:hypothetical protein